MFVQVPHRSGRGLPARGISLTFIVIISVTSFIIIIVLLMMMMMMTYKRGQGRKTLITAKTAFISD